MKLSKVKKKHTVNVVQTFTFFTSVFTYILKLKY